MSGIVTFLSLGNYGRFGNQLFQIAGTIGIARKNGMEPVFPLWENRLHRDQFQSTERINVQDAFVNPLPRYVSHNEGLHYVSIPWGYHEVKLQYDRSYNLQGHMQSLKYFEHCLDEVRHYFTMKEEFPRQHCVAVHVRRGDYDDLYHPRITMEYYAEAILNFPTDTIFQVFSDDIHEVYKEFALWYGATWGYHKKRFRFVNLEEPEYDYLSSFRLMKSCSGFIIGNSSYSAMAAILATAPNKKVVAPLKWFGPAYAAINASDVYCRDWIVI